MSEPLYSEEDIKRAAKIFQRAVEFFNIQDEPSPESAKELYREDGSLDVGKVPLVTVTKSEGSAVFLNIAFFYDDILTVWAGYNPTVTILEFLNEARQLLKARFPHWSDEERDKHAEIEASKMTILLLSRLYPRWNLTMQNIVSEVTQAWFIEWSKWEAQVYSESGIKPIPFSETKMFRGLLKEYENDLLKLWLNAPDKRLEEKKIQLAKEYQSILKHWQKLREWCRNEDADWREYAKAGKFMDTPDDLLSQLEDSEAGKIFHLAIEHAARRAGLFKVTGDAKVLEKRAQQVKVSGYTTRQLFTFLEEGEKLLSEMRAASSLHSHEGTDEANARH